MTAIELDAFKMQLIRDILAINNLEMLDDVKKYVRQLTKIHQSQGSSEFMLNIPATVEELKESAERGLADIKAGRKYMKVYKQMKMYNDPALNPVLYGKK